MIELLKNNVFYEPMLVFTTTEDDSLLRKFLHVLKESYRQVFLDQKISKEKYNKILNNIDYIPFFKLDKFEDYLKRVDSRLDLTNSFYSVLVYEQWVYGVPVKMNKTGEDTVRAISKYDTEMMYGLKLLTQILTPTYLNIREKQDIGSIRKGKGTAEEFFQLFEKNYDKFKWMLEQYLPNMMVVIEMAFKDKMAVVLLDLLNDVWIKLPDEEINLRKHPKGFDEYLELIEDDWCFDTKLH